MHDAQPISPAELRVGGARPPLAGMGIYRRLLGYAKPHRAPILIAIAASAASALAAAAYAYLLGPLLKAVATGEEVHLAGWRIGRGQLSFTVPCLLVALAAFKAATQLLQGGLMQSAGQRVMARLRTDLYRHLLELPPRFFEKRHSGELLSRFASDVAAVEFAITQAFSSYAKDSLQLLALVVVCALLDARLLVAAILLIPTSAFAVSRFSRSVRKIAVRTSARLGRLTELLAEQLHNLPIVQSYRALPRTLERFDEEQRAYLAEMRRSLFLRGISSPTLEFLGVLGVSALIGLGTLAVAAEPDLAAKLLSFSAAALLMYQPLKSLSGTISSVVQGMGSAERLFEITDHPPAADEGIEAGPLTRGVSFEDVRATYDGVTAALRRVSLSVPAGSRVALVGASGAGKTTVFSILLRFLDPSAGLVTWDGTELQTLRPSSVRAQVAWVPQEPVLFSATVRQNLLFARPDASDAELWQALSQANAAELVRALPRALDEVIGERGGTLSGGERQRLAIARAFLRRPSLLLLDEPTSALDAVAEREVQAGLSELMRGRTTVVIAHRLATVRGADTIYVLDAGEVVERGTHAELVALKGRYAALLQQGEVK